MTVAANTHAIVVGIETYDLDAEWDLKGPASDALDCVEWLQQCGVPGDNINLLISPTAARKNTIYARAAGLGFTPDALKEATLANVVQTFENIETTEGDFLLVFWGGHGVVGPLSQRILICADANERNLKDFHIDFARYRLACDVTVGFTQQVFIVDACGDYIESLGDGNKFEVKVPQGLVRRTEVSQAAVYACQSGQSAGQNQVEGYGDFSRVILNELNSGAATLPPDMDAVAKKVREHFDSLNRDGRRGQRPVYCKVQGFDQDSEENWQRGGHRTAAVDMTWLQRGRLHNAIASYEGLQTVDQRNALVAEAVPPDTKITRSSVAAEDLKACLVAIEVGDHFDALFHWLEQDAATASESRKLRGMEIRSLYGHIEEANRIRGRLKNIDLRTPAISAAFLKTTNNQHGSVTPEDLAHALEILLGQQRDPADLLIGRFLLSLERECPGDNFIDSRLLDRLGIDAAKAAEIRHSLASERQRCARLLVDFYGTDRHSNDRGWPPSLGARLQQGDGSWSPLHEEPCDGTPEGAKNAFKELVSWARASTNDKLFIECIVPRCLFNSDFDLWEVKPNSMAFPREIGKDNSLVLRWGERFYIDDLKRSWRSKCETVSRALKTTRAEIHWVPQIDEGDVTALKAVASSIDNSAGAHCVGFEFELPEAPADLVYDPVVAALQTGVGYALWFRGSCDNLGELKNSAYAQLVRSGVKDFPAGLKTLRAQPKAHEEILSRQLIALWDDPFDLPATSNVREPK